MFWFCVGPAFRSSWLLWLPVIAGIVTSPVQAMVELNHKVKMSKDDEVREHQYVCMLAVSAGTNTEDNLLSDTSEWIWTVQHSALTLHRWILMILWCVGSWVLSPLVNVLDLSILPYFTSGSVNRKFFITGHRAPNSFPLGWWRCRWQRSEGQHREDWEEGDQGEKGHIGFQRCFSGFSTAVYGLEYSY